MSDTPKVSAAEALEAYNNVLILVANQRIKEGTGKLFSDLNSASTNDETLRKFIAQQASLESAASRPEGKVLHKGKAVILKHKFSGVLFIECNEHAPALLSNERRARVVVTELPEEEKENG